MVADCVFNLIVKLNFEALGNLSVREIVVKVGKPKGNGVQPFYKSYSATQATELSSGKSGS
jgi:hypothetical protein